jgi:chromosome segregation ATPase
MAESGLSETKEKILFTTNELVVSLNTQVAVLSNSNKALTAAVEKYTEKIDLKMDKLDERDATLDQRITILRNDLTRAEVKIEAVNESIKELKNKSNIFDIISVAFTAIVGTLMYLLFGRQP